jgi:hypothetical protein
MLVIIIRVKIRIIEIQVTLINRKLVIGLVLYEYIININVNYF